MAFHIYKHEGLFTQCNCDCDFLIATNILYGILSSFPLIQPFVIKLTQLQVGNA